MEQLNAEILNRLSDFINDRKVDGNSKLNELKDNVNDLKKLKTALDSIQGLLRDTISENEKTITLNFKRLGYEITSKHKPVEFNKTYMSVEVSPYHSLYITKDMNIKVYAYSNNALELSIPVYIYGKIHHMVMVGNMFNKSYKKVNYKEFKDKQVKTLLCLSPTDNEQSANFEHIRSSCKTRNYDKYMNMTSEYIWDSKHMGSQKLDSFFMNISSSDELDTQLDTFVSDLNNPLKKKTAIHRILMLHQYIIHLICVAQQLFIRLKSENLYPNLYNTSKLSPDSPKKNYNSTFH